MKRFLISVMLMLTVTAMATDKAVIPSPSGLTNTATGYATNDIPLYGFVEAIKVNIPSTYACTATVTIATSEGETVFSLANIAASTVYHPRVASCNASGIALTTNYVRAILCGDKLISTIVTTIATNLPTTGRDIPIEVWLDNK